MRKFKISLSTSDVERLKNELQDYREWQQEKGRELAARLAMLGASVASIRFSRAFYTGDKDVEVSAEETANGYVVRADGESVLFLEFGSGIRYGKGHPENAEFGMGPGTYPSEKGRKASDENWYHNWEHPGGWWLPKEKGGEHTYGNPPAMAMYEARKTILQELPRIVKEVFG